MVGDVRGGESQPGIVDQLQHQLDATLRELGMLDGTRAALVNYPNHHNVGDPALYLGTLRTLRRLGVRVTYYCEHETYSRRTLAGQLERGTNMILINGGGNLGDQYPQQTAREQVLNDFPDVSTVQLPQSIWFAGERNIDRFADIVARHRQLTLVVRDPASLEFARTRLHANLRLAPDMAFGLGRLDRPAEPSQDVLWLRRSDREAASWTGATLAGDPLPVDWLSAAPLAVLGPSGIRILERNRLLARNVTQQPELWRPLAATFGPLAKRRLAFGCALLARGRIVVSDRLHGVLLALLMGIPVVAVDNVTGKVSGFVDTWLRDVRGVMSAPDHRAGLDLARRLVALESPGASSI